MADPVTEKELYKALDKYHTIHKEYDTVIHDTFKESIERIELSVNKIEESIDGNGKAGLKTRVDRLETTNSNIKKFMVAFSGAVGSMLSYLGFKTGS